jgi:hypothetical protein
MGDIVELKDRIITPKDMANAVLLASKDQLKTCVVIGETLDGDFCISTSDLTLAEANLLLDLAKIEILQGDD